MKWKMQLLRKSSVVWRTGCSIVWNFRITHLTSPVESSAAEAIAELTVTSAKYEEAIATLKKRFGNPQLIVDRLMESLLRMSTVRVSQNNIMSSKNMWSSVPLVKYTSKQSLRLLPKNNHHPNVRSPTCWTKEAIQSTSEIGSGRSSLSAISFSHKRSPYCNCNICTYRYHWKFYPSVRQNTRIQYLLLSLYTSMCQWLLQLKRFKCLIVTQLNSW